MRLGYDFPSRVVFKRMSIILAEHKYLGRRLNSDFLTLLMSPKKFLRKTLRFLLFIILLESLSYEEMKMSSLKIDLLAFHYKCCNPIALVKASSYHTDSERVRRAT